jgi:hypothetical protein
MSGQYPMQALGSSRNGNRQRRGLPLGVPVASMSSAPDAMAGSGATIGNVATAVLWAFGLASCLSYVWHSLLRDADVITVIEAFRAGWLHAAAGRLTSATVLYVAGMVATLAEGKVANLALLDR